MGVLESNLFAIAVGIGLLLIAFRVIQQINLTSVLFTVYGFVFIFFGSYTLSQLSA